MLCVPLWIAVQVFRQTIARYRIRHGHILRIFVFTWIGVVVWRSLAETVLTMGTMPYSWWYQWQFPSIVFSVADMIPSIVLVISFGLALSTYLKVRGGWLWALLVLIFAAFFVALPGIVLSVFYYDAFSNPYWEPIIKWFPPARLLPDAVEYAFLWLHDFP